MPKTNPKQQKKKSEDPLARVENPHAAGIDVGAEEMVVAVPQDRCAQPVRTFGGFTADLHALRDWLLECGIAIVALESTGNYWIAIYQILEESGLKVCLINARHIKSINRKKTDVCDAQWLQQLHQAGLLRASFRPDKEIAPLRYVMRHRAAMVVEASRQIQLMQKALTECNLKLHHVFSDLDGESCLRIIEAILAGERDPLRLAAMRDHRCRTPLPKILKDERIGNRNADQRGVPLGKTLLLLAWSLSGKPDFGWEGLDGENTQERLPGCRRLANGCANPRQQQVCAGRSLPSPQRTIGQSGGNHRHGSQTGPHPLLDDHYPAALR